MHMEALDRSFSTGSHSNGGLSLSSYPLTPEPQLNTTQYSDHCLQSEYSSIQYNDNYDYGSQTSLEPSSPISSSTPTLLDTPLHSYQHDPCASLFSRSSYSSNSSCPLFSSSQSSGLSDMTSISNMSISSDASSSSSSSLFSDSQTLYNNPFSTNSATTAAAISHPKSNRKLGTSKASRSSQDSTVPRRSSAPARSVTDNPSRKDSFVYDVQLESDNVLLFIPDLDLVKSHLMFAVREEVDVLKERIGELMERINHLEYENNVLRKYATQDTLQQIQHNAPNP